jgi:flagellar hook-length control protein FliK
MNATPMSINPANTVQAQPAAGKQQDSATPDVPFSQVLSSEMAQNRQSSSEAREGSDVDATQDAAPQAARATEADTDSTTKATPGKVQARDPLAPAEDAMTVPEALLGLAINPDPLKPTPAEAPTPDPQAQSQVPAEIATAAPAAALALAINPDPLKTAPAESADNAAEQPPAQAAISLPFQNARKDQAPQAAQAEPLPDNARDAQKIDPALSGKGSFQAAVAATAATALAGQPAAARQPDTVKMGEVLSDLMSNSAMRTTPHAPFEVLNTPNEIASPKLSPSVGTTAWSQALGEKIVWMATGAQQTATLTLNPPNMGPLQIVVNVSNDQATASFFSAQPEVRQALEAAFPKLREMMNEAGIELGQATVSADTPRQHDTPDRQAQRIVPPFMGTNDAVTAGLQAIHAPVQQSGRGLIDTFA